MNTYQFFNQSFGRHLTEQTNRPSADAWRALSKQHAILNKEGKPSTSRLTGWAIIRPNGASAQTRFEGAEIAYDARTRFEAFAHELEHWDGEPRMFLSFSKAPLPIANLFITADLRAVRVCSPGGVETFDATNPDEKEGGVSERNIAKERRKLNA